MTICGLAGAATTAGDAFWLASCGEVEAAVCSLVCVRSAASENLGGWPCCRGVAACGEDDSSSRLSMARTGVRAMRERLAKIPAASGFGCAAAPV